ncbi:MAG: NUDIX domain-containing protein [Actinomycetota bacterium]|nr:NUDIX domain-containing protein [Actinomycetota bacterium]
MTLRFRPSAKAVVVRDGRLLVTRNQTEGQGDWHILPGGGQRAGETLADALRREVLEETGVLVEPVRLMWVRELIIANHFEDAEARKLDPEEHATEYMFEARFLDEAGSATEVDAHQVAVEWVTPLELTELQFFPRALAGPLGSYLRGGDPGPVYLGDVE